jgi:hypothetical protein
VSAAQWTSVVAALDANRARALTELDPRLLDLVYAADAPARTADLATIGQLRAAGYRLIGAGHDIVAVTVLSTSDPIALRVVESMPQVLITGTDGRTLGHTDGSAPSAVVLYLIHTDDGFRIRSVELG